jgi:hypothetical protein
VAIGEDEVKMITRAVLMKLLRVSATARRGFTSTSRCNVDFTHAVGTASSGVIPHQILQMWRKIDHDWGVSEEE